MPVTVSWHIYCEADGCDAEDTPGFVCETREDAENAFERRGWSFEDGEIRCESCAARGGP